MRYWFDLDGTITTLGGFGFSRIRFPSFLIFLFLKLYKPKIKKSTIKLMFCLNQNNNNEIVIFTTRPSFTKKITLIYLVEKEVPFDRIFFAKNIKEKLDSVEKNDFVFDNSKKVKKEAEKRGIMVKKI